MADGRATGTGLDTRQKAEGNNLCVFQPRTKAQKPIFDKGL